MSCKMIPICPLFEITPHLDEEHDHCNNKGGLQSVDCARYKQITKLMEHFMNRKESK